MKSFILFEYFFKEPIGDKMVSLRNKNNMCNVAKQQSLFQVDYWRLISKFVFQLGEVIREML